MSDRYIAIAFEGRVQVHAASGIANYATVCGLDGDDSGADQEPADLPKRARITCPDCKQMILHCREYTPSRDFSRRKS